MDVLDVENQIILILAVRKFFKLSENKELVMPLIFKWFNERSTQFIPANELNIIIKSTFEVSQEKNMKQLIRPFDIRDE